MAPSLSPAFVSESRKIVRKLSAEILRHEALIKRRDNVEAIHQTRVAVNKLRVALNLLPFTVTRKIGRQIESDLQWFKDALGPVRDADVINELVAALGKPKAQDKVGVDEILLVLQREKRQYQRELRLLMRSDRYVNLKTSLEKMAKKKSAKSNKANDSVADDLLAQNLADVFGPLSAKFEKRRKKLAKAFDPAIMHQLRITGKKLRYALDFFKNIGGDSYVALSETLHKMHDCTGTLHDMDVLGPKVESLSCHWQMVRSEEANESVDSGVEWVLLRLYKKRRALIREFYTIWAEVASKEFQEKLAAIS